MACRHEDLRKLESDKEKIELAIEKLVAARDKSDCVGDECDIVDYNSRQTFITENMMKLSENLSKLNDDGSHALMMAISGLKAGLFRLYIRQTAYQKEDDEYHAAHPDEPIPEESEESA